MLGLKLWILPLGAAVVASALVVFIVISGTSTESPLSTVAETPSDVSAPAEEPQPEMARTTSNPTPQRSVSEPLISVIITPPDGTPAPDFAGIDRWLNSPPLSMGEHS